MKIHGHVSCYKSSALFSSLSAFIMFRYQTRFIFYRSYCWGRRKASKRIESSFSVSASLSFPHLPICLFPYVIAVLHSPTPIPQPAVSSVSLKTLKVWQHFFFFFPENLLFALTFDPPLNFSLLPSFFFLFPLHLVLPVPGLRCNCLSREK